MKTKSIYLALILLSTISWSCTTNQNELSQGTLKTSLNKSVQELTTAMGKISATDGYQVLSISSTGTSASLVKSSVAAFDSTYSSILLSDIAGVYDYKATRARGGSILKYFTKSAESALMVVNLPKEKVKNPSALFHYAPSDTLLTNNYVFSLSKYNRYFKEYKPRSWYWDYDMASNISIDNVNVGDLKIQSSNTAATGYKIASEFVFADKYVAKCVYATGDTAVATYNVSDGTKTLYEEKYTAIKTIKTFGKHREQEYSLTIGNVQIIRKQGPNALDSAKVYVAGVLQLNSKVEIVEIAADSAVVDNSIVNHKRDLKITFDDGTSSTLTELLGTSLDTIRTLFASLRQASFATSVIDTIAWDIYSNK
ncbi:MAG: hypothetical protein WCJ61_13610 [Paludibacter sp.]